MKEIFRDSLLDSLSEMGFTPNQAQEIYRLTEESARDFFEHTPKRKSTRITIYLPACEWAIGFRNVEVKVFKSWLI